MITAITLENFKGIRDRVRIELKPITLLFGANSAGKSTIIQALHYALEVLNKRNLDPNQTVYGGSTINLGRFKNLIHNKDLNKQIVIRLDLDFSVRSYIPNYGLEGEDSASIDYKIKTAWVEFAIGWDKTDSQVVVSYYKTGINGIEVATLYKNNGQIILKINEGHPVFLDKDEEIEIENEDRDEDEGEDQDFTPIPLILPTKSPLPQWGVPLVLAEENEYFESRHFSEENGRNLWITQAVVGPGEAATKLLQKFYYLGPLRHIPERNYQPNFLPSHEIWADGQGAWDLLYHSEKPFLETVNLWLSSEEKLNTGYSVHIKKHKEINLDSYLIESLNNRQEIDVEKVRTEIDKLPITQHLFLKEIKSGLTVSPQEIGIGISQILPVVVTILEAKVDDIVAIEQPELHIHPAIQVRLGDLFISKINKQKRLSFLIETHSEHLILRLLRRIRETTSSKIDDSGLMLFPDMVSVIYVESTPEGVRLTPLPIDKTGEFIDQWPKGFFEEREEELFS